MGKEAQKTTRQFKYPVGVSIPGGRGHHLAGFLRCFRVWKQMGEGTWDGASMERSRFFESMDARDWREASTRTRKTPAASGTDP